MEHDEFAVARLLDVQLDHFDAEVDRVADGGDGILGMARPAGVDPAAAMRHDHHMVAPQIGVFQPLADLADAGCLCPKRHGMQRRDAGKDCANNDLAHENRSQPSTRWRSGNRVA